MDVGRAVITVLALVATIIVLAGYLRGGRIFDWANVIGAPFIALPALTAGAWSSVIVTFCFGLIGFAHLTARRER